MGMIAAPLLTTIGTPLHPVRVIYCISRPRSSRLRLSTATQQTLDELLSPEFRAVPDSTGVTYQGLRKTYCIDAAQTPAALWSDNSPTPDPTILQPRQWLQDVVGGATDVLVLDGLYALSVNPAILLPVTATIANKGGIILVINMEGPVAVYAAHALYEALGHVVDWLKRAIDRHRPGGEEMGEDSEHFAESTSVAAAMAELRKAK